MPSLIEIGLLVLEKKMFFNINICKYGFPYCGPSRPRGPWFVQTWIYIISESFHVNVSSSGSVVLEKKIFKWPHPIFAFLWLSPLWRGPGPLFEQFIISFTQGWFMPSLIEIGQLVLKKKIFFNINICKYGFPYCCPSRPLGTMMLTILNLHYIKKLSCKYELFWLSGSGEEDSSMTEPHFCSFVIISPLKRTWPLIWII